MGHGGTFGLWYSFGRRLLACGMSGQDVERGTFSSSSCVMKSWWKWGGSKCFWNHISENRELSNNYNSLLSEYGVVGFWLMVMPWPAPIRLAIWEGPIWDFSTWRRQLWSISTFRPAGIKWKLPEWTGYVIGHMAYESQGRNIPRRMEPSLQLVR